MHRSLLSILVLTATAVAQSYTVSPSSVGTGEGNTNNNFPWTFNPGHYQQFHGDLKGTPRTITGLAFRRDGSLGTSTTYVAKTLDAELFMGDGNFATASSTFASNYVSTPVNVFTRKNLSLPDWSTIPAAPPAPWNLTVALDTPFSYTGVYDLVWEIVTYAGTTSGYPGDAHSFTTSMSATSVTTGSTTGCLATGRTTKMGLSASSTTSYITQLMSVTWSGTQAPASAPCAFVLGLVNPNLPVPGLCANLYVDQVFMTINATAASTGTFSSGAVAVPYNPALVGFQIQAQGVAADAGQTAGLPVALTNGLQTPLAAMPPTPGDKVARIYLSGSTGPVGTLGLYLALVTRFTH